jgi:hypothetical protein
LIFNENTKLNKINDDGTFPNQIIEHNEIQINSEKYIEQVKN